MAFVVTSKCIKCKFMDCVEVCPVSAFTEGDVMVAIDPDLCIDCGVCESVCPINAIKPDVELNEEEEKWAKINKDYSKIWPSVTFAKGAMEDADKWAEVPGEEKEEHFNEDAGEGDL